MLIIIFSLLPYKFYFLSLWNNRRFPQLLINIYGRFSFRSIIHGFLQIEILTAAVRRNDGIIVPNVLLQGRDLPRSLVGKQSGNDTCTIYIIMCVVLTPFWLRRSLSGKIPHVQFL